LPIDSWIALIQTERAEEARMLQKSQAAATIPAIDIARARAFYEGKLGFKPDPEMEEDGGALYRCSDGTGFLVFASSGRSSGSHTQLTFEVKDLDSEVSQLKANGVELEDYDLPGVKTENGIAQRPDGKGGWFKDTEGNLIAIFQRVKVAAPSRS
jgi:predicted enzyme related to lactoylglutathione lyase